MVKSTHFKSGDYNPILPSRPSLARSPSSGSATSFIRPSTLPPSVCPTGNASAALIA